MGTYPELERLLGLLATADAASPLAVVAAADQLAGAASTHPRNLVRRAHASIGAAAVRAVSEPGEPAELGFEVACRAAEAIMEAASVVDDLAEDISER